MQYLAILGRQPEISLAELISLYPGRVQRLHKEVALIQDGPLEFDRLGGCPKLAEVIATTPVKNLRQTVDLLADRLSPYLPDKKAVIGLSVYEKSVRDEAVWASSLRLKKDLRGAGHKVRIVPGNQMNSAQIQYNRLTSHGADVVIASSTDTTYIGITRHYQAIERYALRDHSRPARSAKVGMLPPKLSQIMINLANPDPDSMVLDPFCGTGVILQEALLMGYPAYGSDIDQELVDMSQRNLDWLQEQFGATGPFTLDAGDATTKKWMGPIGSVVTEGYLGPALTAHPSSEQLSRLKSEATDLTLRFFRNLQPQLTPQTPICITLPAWRQPKGFARLEVIDQIEALGYTVKQFSPVQQTDLVYARPDQFVGRELVVVRRK